MKHGKEHQAKERLSLFTMKAFTVRQAAEYMGVSRDTVRRRIEAGDLSHFQKTPRGPYFIPQESLFEYERQRREQASLPEKNGHKQ